MRIIFLVDDPDLQASLEVRLRGEGFELDPAGTVLEFYRGMAIAGYDIAVLDLDVSGGGAMDAVSWLRRKDGMGIVLLTPPGEVEDRIEAYWRGADLCLVKPVAGDELAAALRSLFRRLRHGEGREREAAGSPVQWLLDLNHWTLQAPNGKLLKLSTAELRIASRLVERPGTAIPREELLTALGYRHDKSGSQKIDTLISRFRHKIQSRTGCAAPIQTARGRGHLFSAPVRVDGA